MAGPRIAIIKVDVDTGELVDWGVENGAMVLTGPAIKSEIEEQVRPKVQSGDKGCKRLGLLFSPPATGGCIYWDGTKWVKWC